MKMFRSVAKVCHDIFVNLRLRLLVSGDNSYQSVNDNSYEKITHSNQNPYEKSNIYLGKFIPNDLLVRKLGN